MSDDTPDEGDVPPWLDPDPSDNERSIDLLVGALADRRARYAVSALESRSDKTVTLGDLADSVAKREVRAARDDLQLNDADLHDAELAAMEPDDDVEEHRQRVVIALHHRCLPKLDDAAVLDYDPRSNMVRYWGDGRLSAYLEFFDREANV
jgi:hypothetical protein